MMRNSPAWGFFEHQASPVQSWSREKATTLFPVIGLRAGVEARGGLPRSATKDIPCSCHCEKGAPFATDEAVSSFDGGDRFPVALLRTGPRCARRNDSLAVSFRMEWRPTPGTLALTAKRDHDAQGEIRNVLRQIQRIFALT